MESKLLAVFANAVAEQTRINSFVVNEASNSRDRALEKRKGEIYFVCRLRG